jgi:hypothetical protein
MEIAMTTAINAEQIKIVASGLTSSGNPGKRLNIFSTAFMGIAP